MPNVIENCDFLVLLFNTGFQTAFLIINAASLYLPPHFVSWLQELLDRSTCSLLQAVVTAQVLVCL